MKLVACVVLVLAVLWGCSSPPKPPEPTGQWVPVNQPTAQQASRTEPKNEDHDDINNQTVVCSGFARAKPPPDRQGVDGRPGGRSCR